MSRTLRLSAALAAAALLPLLGTSTARADETDHRPGDVEITSGARTGLVTLAWSPGAIESPDLPGTSATWRDPRWMSLRGDRTGLSFDVTGPKGGWSVTVYPTKGQQLVIGKTYVVAATAPQGPDASGPTLAGSAPGYTCAVKTGDSKFVVNALTPGQLGRPSKADVSFHIACLDDAKGKNRFIDGRAAMSNRPMVTGMVRPFSLRRGGDGILRARVLVSCTEQSVPQVDVTVHDATAQGIAVTERRCAPGRPRVATIPLHELGLDGSGGPRLADGAQATVATGIEILDALYGEPFLGSGRTTMPVRPARVPHLHH